MLGNLVASCLLAGAVAVNVPKAPLTTDEAITLEMPKKVVNNTVLNGAYVLGTGDEYYYFNQSLSDHDIELEIVSTNNTPFVYCIYQGAYESGNYVYDKQWLPLTSLELYYASDTNYIRCYFTFNSDVGSDVYELGIASGDDPSDIYISRTNNSAGVLDSTYLALYFNKDFNITVSQRLLFDTVFKSQLNERFVRYSGWYHLNENFNVPSWQWVTVLGDILVQNMYYNQMVFSLSNPSVITASYFADSSSLNSYYIYVYSDGWRITSRNIMFTNIVLTDTAVSRLQSIGVFNFVISETDYSLTDLFVDVADTPVIFITSLFDFELFGTTFYVAFLGIVTVIAIIFILKKVL